MKLDYSESVLSCLDYDPDDKLLQAAKKVVVNCNNRVTEQSSKEQYIYLGRFFMKNFSKEEKTLAFFNVYSANLCSFLTNTV